MDVWIMFRAALLWVICNEIIAWQLLFHMWSCLSWSRAESLQALRPSWYILWGLSIFCGELLRPCLEVVGAYSWLSAQGSLLAKLGIICGARYWIWSVVCKTSAKTHILSLAPSWTFILIYLIIYWIIPGKAQGWLLVLLSEIIPGDAGGLNGMLGIKFMSNVCKATVLPTILSLQTLIRI